MTKSQTEIFKNKKQSIPYDFISEQTPKFDPKFYEESEEMKDSFCWGCEIARKKRRCDLCVEFRDVCPG